MIPGGWKWFSHSYWSWLILKTRRTPLWVWVESWPHRISMHCVSACSSSKAVNAVTFESRKIWRIIIFSGYFLALFCFSFGLRFRLMTTTDNMKAVSNLPTLDYPIPDRWTIFQCEKPQAKERRELLEIQVVCSYEAVFYIEAHWHWFRALFRKISYYFLFLFEFFFLNSGR